MEAPKNSPYTRLSFVESYLEVMDIHIDQAIQQVQNDCLAKGVIRSTIYLSSAIRAYYLTLEKELATLYEAIPEYGIIDKQLDKIKDAITKYCLDKLGEVATKANTLNESDLDTSETKKQINVLIDMGIIKIKNKRDAEKAAEKRNHRLVVIGWVITIVTALANIQALTDLIKAGVKAILKQP